MPIYDYRCTSCGHRFEARQGFNDDPVAQCPTCGERSERQITAVAVHFKGSGFYKTDYKSGNGRASSNGNGNSADSTTESKTEAAPSSSAPASTDSSKSPSTESTKSKAKETVAKSDK